MENRKEEIIQAIKNNIENIIEDGHSIVEMKAHLAQHGILGGQVEKVLSTPKILEEEDIREIALVLEQFFVKTGKRSLNPEKWFTEIEMQEAREYDKRVFSEDTKDDPVVFENVTMIGRGVYSTEIDVDTLLKLTNNQVLYYDFDIQRQPTKRKGSATPRATVYKKNVREIKDLLIKGRLVETTLAFNAHVGSNKAGEEFEYDPQARTVTLIEGTRLAVLDGYHRYLGSLEALRKNPELKFKFMLRLSNVTKRECQVFQSQLAKATPIPKTRMEMLEANRFADTVAQALMADSELKDRVASQHRITPNAGEIVSYNVLADSIEREFPMEFRRDTNNVTKYLAEFFDELIAEYSDEFLYNTKDNKSLMNYNKMFAGYIALAARMKNEGIELDQLSNILNSIDFSRENPIWNEIGILDESETVNKKVDERKIANYFKTIKV